MMDGLHIDIFDEISKIITGKENDDVIPVLIVTAARALVLEADGDHNKLSTLLLKFCQMVEDEAAEMLRDEQ